MGTPAAVSAALVVAAGLLGERVRRVLAVIDSVHWAGPLPRIPIDDRVGVLGADGRYRFHRGRGRAQGIGLLPAAEHLELVLVHEIGHFLDHQALGRPGSFASIRHPDLADWRRTTMASRALREMFGRRRLAELSGVPIAAFDYLVGSSECWARSYAQFIIARSADRTLALQLEETRQRTAPYNLAQWEDDDFGLIAATIDELFQRRGWL